MTDQLITKPLHVVQWATGTVGDAAMRRCGDAAMREVLSQLVGAKVYSAAKEGRDVRELCGAPPTGVKAVRDIKSIMALKPDCVPYICVARPGILTTADLPQVAARLG